MPQDAVCRPWRRAALAGGPAPGPAATPKTRFFARLGLTLRETLRLHRAAGLWERANGARPWRNVSEHCIVESARAAVLADLVGLPDASKRSLIVAAALHDCFKRIEVETGASASWDRSAGAAADAEKRLRAAGFADEVVDIASAVGHASLRATEERLRRAALSFLDLACLILHYVDAYTIDSRWTVPAAADGGGATVNDLDRRVERSRANPRYARLEAEAATRLGETISAAQRRIGRLVERRLAELVGERTGVPVDSLDLPVVVDDEIRRRIARDFGP